ncbi:MAG: hypothetical protein RR557_09090 [Bacilli bacterium]|jgi:hypothetical protein
MAPKRQSRAPLGSVSRHENTKDLQGSNKDSKDLISVSFQCFVDQDTDYCQSLSTWESEGLLSQMNVTFIQLCKETTANPQRLTKYGSYPEKSKTGFPECPKNLSKSANWSSIRLSGKVRVIGIMDRNIFYVVYLDKNHLFYLSPKKHT